MWIRIRSDVSKPRSVLGGDENVITNEGHTLIRILNYNTVQVRVGDSVWAGVWIRIRSDISKPWSVLGGDKNIVTNEGHTVI